MTGIELLLGAVIGWATRKARRVGGRADEQVDAVLDAGVNRLGELVAGKLGSDAALAKLEAEAAIGEISSRTRERLRLAVEDASEEDPEFAAALASALQQLQAATAVANDSGGTTVLGGVTVRAEGGSNAAWSITGPVVVGMQPSPARRSEEAPPDPPAPDRP